MRIRIRSVAVMASACLTAFVSAQSPWESEIVYQVFPRSFYDSNGDRIGDFKGIQSKLGYIAGLGATAILLQPVQKSRFYHNYFPDSFFETDPSFGTNKDFFDLVRAAHRRHLKVILDMEQQYVASLHPWYIAAANQPDSPEAKNVFLRTGYLHFRGVPSYNGQTIPIATINTNQPEVLETLKQVFQYWAAPPGRSGDGVDGFRLDHMMNDLDNNHSNTDMLARVWTPIEESVRRIKPSIFFVAEQSDWSTFGGEQFTKGHVDAVYAIPLLFAFRSLDAAKIRSALEASLGAAPPGKTQFVLVGDHDVERYASVVDSAPKLLRLGAALELTTKGTPSIYYGDELGLKGIQVKGRTDGNDIPVRLAMRWSRTLEAPGTATWYGPGPWNKPEFSASGDGISVEEESPDPDSLLNFYRRMIALRKRDSALRIGTEEVLDDSPPGVLAFRRRFGNETVLVAINLGDRPASLPIGKGRNLWNSDAVSGSITVEPKGFRIVRIEG